MKKPPRKRVPAPAAPALPLWKKGLFSAVVVLGALAVLEGGARLLTTIAPNSRWQFHRQLIDSVGFPALNEVMVPDPVLFWSLRPGLDQKVLAGRIAASVDLRFTVSTDSSGARRLPEASGPRRLVAFLGDSCTFGVGVGDDETFAALLQQQMTGVRALDLGVPGYTAYQGRMHLARYPFAAPPAVVVVAFGFNDESVWDNRGDLEQAEALDRQNTWMYASRFVRVLGTALSRPPAVSAAPPTARRPRLSDEEFSAEIRAIAGWCRSRGAKPLLVLWPYRVQATRTDMSPKQRALLRVAAEDDLPLVNLVPVVRAGGGERLFLDVVHANAEGHSVVASALAPRLAEMLAVGGGATR